MNLRCHFIKRIWVNSRNAIGVDQALWPLNYRTTDVLNLDLILFTDLLSPPMFNYSPILRVTTKNRDKRAFCEGLWSWNLPPPLKKKTIGWEDRPAKLYERVKHNSQGLPPLLSKTSPKTSTFIQGVCPFFCSHRSALNQVILLLSYAKIPKLQDSLV